MEYSQDEDEDEDEDSKIVSRHREQFLIKLPSKFIAAGDGPRQRKNISSDWKGRATKWE